MKQKLVLTLLAFAGLTNLTAVAQDDAPRPGGPGGPGRGRQPSPDEIKKYDKDGDGKLSEEERTALRTDREKAMLEKYDADKNGKLDEAETAKMREENPRGRGGPGARGRFQPSPEDIKKYDADNDGKLDEAETRALREARQKEALEKFDADKDGKLSEDERRTMMEAMRKERGNRRPGGSGGESRPTTPKIPVPSTE